MRTYLTTLSEEDIVLFKTIKKSTEATAATEVPGGHPVGEILRDYNNSLKSPKELFFPPREVLFEFSDKELRVPAPAAGELRTTVIWGVRPCDAHSLVILDKVFDGDYKDNYYLEKREY